MDFITIILLLLFLVGIVIAYLVGRRNGVFQRDKYWEGQIPDYRKEAIMKSRAVIGGQFSEQLAPFLPGFKYLPTECKFIGKPIDFLVFKGMDDKNINEIVFMEVKSGNSKLSAQEKNLKDTIDKKKVRWEEYRIPEGITKRKEEVDGKE
jgi:predicted Holliday junction resolvase-like endonuclease